MKKYPGIVTLAIVAGGAPAILWLTDIWIDIQHDLGWVVAVSAAAVSATIALCRRWRANARAAYHEGYADGYLRGASDRIGEGLNR